MRLAVKSFSVLACALAVQLAWGGTTGKISGRVLDAKTREALVGVNVSVLGTKLGGTTDIQGDYFVTSIPPGTYTVRATQVGYKQSEAPDVRVRVDATTEVNFRMEETVLEVGQEVVITAQRPLVEKDNTSTRTFMESGEILNRPATEVAEVVATLPSINVENGVMKVRGGALNEVSFLIDGTRAWNPLNQQPYTNINLSSIQEMEVITGSYNAEYGEARSGIFNIITKEGASRYSFSADLRYQAPGVKHWGPSLYDPATPDYWENTHARHLQWWIDHPDQWVDPNGLYGNDPRTSWTPEQAYQNYLQTHQPLTNYDKVPDYQVEVSFGGPVPGVETMTFFVTGKYHYAAPIMGNSFYKHGDFLDFTGKLAYQLDQQTKLLVSGFYGSAKTAWGIGGGTDVFWAQNYGVNSRYAYYDIQGISPEITNGLTAKLTGIPDNASMYEVKLSETYAKRVKGIFPGDPVGWDATQATQDNLRAGVVGGNQNNIGYHTTGYYDRHEDRNTTWNLDGYYSNQLSKNIQLKAGAQFTYYNLNHDNESKLPARIDSAVYNPYQGAVYVQNKFEFSGFIMNLGLRLDLYNANNTIYSNYFNPLGSTSEKSKLFTQLSPRLGISHPIDESTVLHFSYGHFFQRPPFGDYGEGNSGSDAVGSLTTFLVRSNGNPWVLGNRNVKPEQTIAFELGIERNLFEEFVLGATAYYKDIRNLITSVAVVDPPREPYRTNGNADYGDVRGVELSLREQPTRHTWGTTNGYVNFTTQIGINGRSGSPQAITPTGPLYGASGDYIVYNNPRLKAGVYYETPDDAEFLGGLLKRLSVSFDYVAVFPNDQLLSDFVPLPSGGKYIRPPDQNTNLRLRKDFRLWGSNSLLGFYVEVRNLFNAKWINLDIVKASSLADQEAFASSGGKTLPTADANGIPLLELAKFRNLPRSIIFGASLEL
jgi:outer membrane receptor protein involved in Fe transport